MTERVRRPGWFLNGLLLGFFLGAAAFATWTEWVVRQHYERATKAESQVWQLEAKLANEYAFNPCKGRR